MRKGLALLLVALLLLSVGCIRVPHRDTQAGSTPDPTKAPAATPLPTPTHTPAPTEAPTPALTLAPTAEPTPKLTKAVLLGTWKMVRMMEGDSPYDMRALTIESYLTFYSNGDALYYWHTKTYTERITMSYMIHGDAAILMNGRDSVAITYDGVNDLLSLPWDSSLQVYERSPALVIPTIEPPAAKSKTADGLWGVWQLTELSTELEQHRDYVLLVNSWIARGEYDLRYQFKQTLSATEYFFDRRQEYMQVFRYTVDWEQGFIRSNDPVRSLHFTLDGDELWIDNNGIFYRFARYGQTDPA